MNASPISAVITVMDSIKLHLLLVNFLLLVDPLLPLILIIILSPMLLFFSFSPPFGYTTYLEHLYAFLSFKQIAGRLAP